MAWGIVARGNRAIVPRRQPLVVFANMKTTAGVVFILAAWRRLPQAAVCPVGYWRGDLTLIGFVFVVLHLVELHEALAAGQKGGRFVPQAVSASSCWSGRGGWLDKVVPSS